MIDQLCFIILWDILEEGLLHAFLVTYIHLRVFNNRNCRNKPNTTKRKINPPLCFGYFRNGNAYFSNRWGTILLEQMLSTGSSPKRHDFVKKGWKNFGNSSRGIRPSNQAESRHCRFLINGRMIWILVGRALRFPITRSRRRFADLEDEEASSAQCLARGGGGEQDGRTGRGSRQGCN